MLDEQDINATIQILNSTDIKIYQLYELFTRAFPVEPKRVEIALALCIFFQEGLFPKEQRMVCLFLFETFKPFPGLEHPFFAMFQLALDDDDMEVRQLASLLLSGQDAEVQESRVMDIKIYMQTLSSKKTAQKRNVLVEMLEQHKVPPIEHRFKLVGSLERRRSYWQDIFKAILSRVKSVYDLFYIPKDPVVLFPDKDCGHWVEWKYDSDQHILLHKASSEVLTTQEQEDLLLAMKKSVFETVGWTTIMIEGLMENNPEIASAALSTLLKGKDAEEYLNTIQAQPLSLSNLGVVHELAVQKVLPHDFIRGYILQCLQSCQDMKDHSHQVRMVRWVSFFLQSLLQHHSFILLDLFINIQSFCIQFARIHEVTCLFQQISNLIGFS